MVSLIVEAEAMVCGASRLAAAIEHPTSQACGASARSLLAIVCRCSA